MPTFLQATLDSAALRQLIRILTCLSKYGDDLIILASPDRLLLHTTNLAQTAYGRIIYSRHFFSRYRVEQPLRDNDYTVDGQLSTKSLLGVLKPRTVERTVEKCDLSIVYGDTSADGQENAQENSEEVDSLESKLIVRLHCKHGVVKTHRLLLSETTRHMAPNVPESPEQSNLTIPPKNLKDILDQFHTVKGGKKDDPQLVWTFDGDHVVVRTQEGLSVKGNNTLATEFTVSADEFTIYDLYSPPTTIAFHLREFGAVMAFAETSNHAINLQFTVNGNPLFIQPDNGDFYETLFIIALSQFVMPNSTDNTANNSQTSNRSGPQRQIQPQRRKRPLEGDSVRSVSPSSVNGNGSERGNPVSQIRQRIERTPIRPQVPAQHMKAVVAMDRAPSRARGNDAPSPGGSIAMPPPSLPASLMNQQHSTVPSQPPTDSQSGQKEELYSPPPSPRRRASQIPLFLPGSQLSQLSRADEEAIIKSGLGIENMDVDEFQAMMEADGEEVEWNMGDDDRAVKNEDGEEAEIVRENSLDIFEMGTQLPPTQESAGSKVFRPLFDD